MEKEIESAYDDYTSLVKTVETYFHGLYHSDTKTLKTIFDPHASIVGFYEGEEIHHSLAKYLQFVNGVSAPSQIDEDYDMQIMSIDQTGPIAIVRVRFLYEALYHNEFLSFKKNKDHWLIVQKLFCHDD
ncbi:MAG: nuclear transport factor 2 family protein [Gammaproteobacteria bacterium]|nr:nuclear transport factor 2 family protein [Gammaproteobacteria bacterium]